MKILIILLSFALSAKVIAKSTENSIDIGKSYTIRSAILQEDRTILVNLPRSYKRSHKYTRYPVIYLLDGEKFFHSFTGAVRQLSSDATPHIPEMIVVGIKSQQRVRDSSPTHSLVGPSGVTERGYETSGGADQFISFIEKELIPYIDKNYSTSDYRIFTGYSFTGVPVIHTLFTRPNIFDAFIAIDPSWWWDEFILEKRAKKFIKDYSAVKKELFVAVHSRPYPSDLFPTQENVMTLIDILSHSDIKGLNWGHKIYTDETHHSMPMISLYDGLIHIFRGYRPSLHTLYKDPSKLERQYKQLSERLGSPVVPQEGLMNFFGYQFLNTYKDIQKALIYFELNVKNYPESSGAWRALGDAYSIKGEKDKADFYYKKSDEME